MIFLIVLAALAIVAVLGYRKLSRLFRGSPRRPGRWAALLLVVAVLGIQSVVMAPAASAAACGQSPNPERPGSGMVGALDPSEGQGTAGSAYIDYNYAGMVWNTFQSDCGPLSGLSNSGTELNNWVGNQLFNVAKVVVGATNALHYAIVKGGLLGPLTDAVKSGAQKVYDNVYAKLFGLVALLLAIVMFASIWRGDLARVSKRALYFLAAMWLAVSSFTLLRYFEPIDKTIVEASNAVQAGLITDDNDAIIRDVLPTELHTQIVFNNWLSGEFGSSTSPEAVQFGRNLLDAQAFTWNQLRSGEDGKQEVIDAKKKQYQDIFNQLKTSKGYFTGEAGNRIGSGFLALAQSLLYALFQLLAKAAILLALLLIRLFVLLAPLVGLVAMLHHDTLRRVFRVVGTAFFSVGVLTVLAGVHFLLLRTIFASDLSVIMQMVIAGIATVVMLMFGRPISRLKQMVQAPVNEFGGSLSMGGGIFSRFRRNTSGEPTKQEEFWQGVKAIDGVVEPRQDRVRPEANVIHAVSERIRSAASGRTPTGGYQSAGQAIAAGTSAGRALPAAGSAAAAEMVFAAGDPRAPQSAQRRGSSGNSPRFVAQRGSDPVVIDGDSVLVPSRMEASEGPVSSPRPTPVAPEPEETWGGKPVVYSPNQNSHVTVSEKSGGKSSSSRGSFEGGVRNNYPKKPLHREVREATDMDELFPRSSEPIEGRGY